MHYSFGDRTSIVQKMSVTEQEAHEKRFKLPTSFVLCDLFRAYEVTLFFMVYASASKDEREFLMGADKNTGFRWVPERPGFGTRPVLKLLKYFEMMESEGISAFIVDGGSVDGYGRSTSPQLEDFTDAELIAQEEMIQQLKKQRF